MADDPLLIRGSATIRDYIKGAEEEISRRRLIPMLLKQKGLIVRNCGGDGFQWQFEFRQAVAESNNGAQSITPAPVDRYRDCYLTWKGLAIHDKMSWREYQLNKNNKSQLIPIFSKLGKQLVRDMGDSFHETFYGDGTGTESYDGFGSFVAYTQTLQEGASTPTARSANAADRLGAPDDSYATKDTDFAALGGSWTGDYYGGTGTPDYDAFSPIIVRTQSTGFGGTSWQTNAVEAVRFGNMMCLMRKPQGDGNMDTAMFPQNMWFQLANRLDAKERVTVKEAFGSNAYGQDPARGVLIIDGVKVTWEYGVPTNRGYGLNFGSMEYRSCIDGLSELDPDAPKWVGTESGWHWIARMLGNFKFVSPRDFVLWDNNY